MNYRIETPPDAQAALALLDERIYEFNQGATGRRDGLLFARYAFDETAAMVGGIAGWTWAGASEISYLWVEEAHRGHGLGRQLLQAAEDEVRQAGCAAVLLRSYSFQAPQFYEKLGYRVEHVVEDFPPGCRYYTLIKRLS